MKKTTLIFYGNDAQAAKNRALACRQARGTGLVRDAAAFTGEYEHADAVEILPCASPYDRARVAAAYGDKVASAVSPPPPPPPPPVADPLANLPNDWQGMPATELRKIAAAVTGRTPQNKDEAVQMISAELAKG